MIMYDKYAHDIREGEGGDKFSWLDIIRNTTIKDLTRDYLERTAISHRLLDLQE